MLRRAPALFAVGTQEQNINMTAIDTGTVTYKSWRFPLVRMAYRFGH